MTKILLSGCNGYMGQAVTRIADKDDDVEIVVGIDLNSERKGGYPVYSSMSQVTESVHVIIDFSNPSLLNSILTFADLKGIPAIICTTGLSKDDVSRINYYSEKIPIFFSANMSLGINLLINLVTRAAKMLEDSFDIEIVERHHNQKVDAPSGTALAIADALADAVSYAPEYIYDRHSVRKKRDKREIGIHALRGGTIVGDHSVIFAGTDEIIEINHAATSKEVFAAGAVKAAKFIKGKPCGLYSMNDLINAY